MTLVYNGYGEDGMPSWIDDEKVNKFDIGTPDWNVQQFKITHDGLDPNTSPTTLKLARELGYFGKELTNFPDADNFISQLFQSKGLNEQQALAATIQGQKAHEAKFGQGYDTASSLAGIFNDFILPAAGVSGIQGLETLPGWSRDDAAARGKKAADLEHGGDFGSATGLGQILSYQSNLGGNIAEAWKQDPERALLGINTPFESSVWGAATGKDYRPTVDMTGGSTAYDTQSAQAKGIDTQSGEAMQQIAKMLAMKFGGGAVNGLFGEGGSTGSSTLVGDAGNDTLSGSGTMGDEYDPFNFSGGDNNDFFNGFDSDPLMPPAQAPDYFGGYNIDPNTGDVYFGSGDNPFGANFSGGTGNEGFNGYLGGSSSYLQQAQDLVKKYGPNALKFLQGNSGLLGGILGAGAGLVGGAKPAGSTTTTQDIPDWLKPYVVGNLNSAASVANGINPNNPLLDQAQLEASKTVSGGYLDPNSNPYLKDTYDQGAKSVTDSYLSTTQPRTDALFSKGGAFGNGNSAYMETVARNQFGLGNNLKDLATNIYGGNYQQERSRQAAMTASAPQFVAQQADARLAPFKSFQTLFPNISATSTPYFSNPIGNAFSGGLAGYGLSKAFGS